jgi:hypothetical protein
MRLESLDRAHPDAARAELDVLAQRLRDSGWTVEVAGPGEPHWARLQKGGGHELLDVLNVVLDEAERHLIDVVISTVVSWAVHRRFFRGREATRPTVVIWIDGKVIRAVELPESDESEPDDA